MKNNYQTRNAVYLASTLAVLTACAPLGKAVSGTKVNEDLASQRILPEREIEQSYIFTLDGKDQKQYLGIFNPLETERNVAVLSNSGLESKILDQFAAHSDKSFADVSKAYPKYRSSEQIKFILKDDYQTIKGAKSRDPNDRDILELSYHDVLEMLKKNAAFGFVKVEPIANPDGSATTYQIQICADGFSGMVFYDDENGQRIKLQDSRFSQPNGFCTDGEQVLNYSKQLQNPLRSEDRGLDHPYMTHPYAGVDTYRCKADNKVCRDKMRKIETEINARNSDRMKRNQNSGARK